MDRLNMTPDRMLLIADVDSVVSVVLALRQKPSRATAVSEYLAISCGVISGIIWYLFDHRYAFRSPSSI
jgi:hypothetical protein